MIMQRIKFTICDLNRLILKMVYIINNFTLLRILMFIIALTNIGYANADYQEIKSFEKNALALSGNYKSEVVQQVASSEKEMKFVLNKNDFFNEQREKLQMAFRNQGKPKNSADVLVFVSFSIPAVALKSLIQQSTRYHATLIIQGLVENSLPKTIAKINELIKATNNKGGFQIDPNLFNEYKINRVPAIVIGDAENFDVVYGMGNIKEALEFFRDKKGAQANKAARLLNDA